MYFKKIDVYTLTAKMYILLIYIQILYFKNFTPGRHLRGYPLHLHSPIQGDEGSGEGYRAKYSGSCHFFVLAPILPS